MGAKPTESQFSYGQLGFQTVERSSSQWQTKLYEIEGDVK